MIAWAMLTHLRGSVRDGRKSMLLSGHRLIFILVISSQPSRKGNLIRQSPR